MRHPVYEVVEAPNVAHMPAVALLKDGSWVTVRFGWTQERARRRGILALAEILEKDLTARYEH